MSFCFRSILRNFFSTYVSPRIQLVVITCFLLLFFQVFVDCILSANDSVFQKDYRYDQFGTHDFVEYWAAYKLFSSGENPYNASKLLAVEKSVGYASSQPLMMWNPPWLLLFMSPVLRLEFSLAAKLWLLVNTILFMVGIYIASRVFFDNAQNTSLGMAGALVNFPLWYSLELGQSSVFLFLGAAILLWSLHYEKYWATGCGLLLLSVKPHITYLWTCSLLYFVITRRVRTIVFSASAFILGAIILTTFLSPRSLLFWLDQTNNNDPNNFVPVLAWQVPTLVGLLRHVISNDELMPVWPVIVLPGISMVILLLLFVRRSIDFNWRWLVPPLLCMSCFLSPFGWVFDCSVLVITQLAVIGRASLFGRWQKYLIVGLLLGLQVVSWGLKAFYIQFQHEFFWYAPSMFGIWIMANLLEKNSKCLSMVRATI